jgi:hypothetical protein
MSDIQFCPFCGRKCKDEATFCSTCGKKLPLRAKDFIARQNINEAQTTTTTTTTTQAPKRVRIHKHYVVVQPSNNETVIADAQVPLEQKRSKVRTKKNAQTILLLLFLVIMGGLLYQVSGIVESFNDLKTFFSANVHAQEILDLSWGKFWTTKQVFYPSTCVTPAIGLTASIILLVVATILNCISGGLFSLKRHHATFLSVVVRLLTVLVYFVLITFLFANIVKVTLDYDLLEKVLISAYKVIDSVKNMLVKI